MRIPCTICGATILPVTAQQNDGLCGQCVKAPAIARAKANRARIVEGYGIPSAEGITKRLSELTEKSAQEAMDRFSNERIYAFVLLADPQMECAVPRTMTETWVAQMPEGARWGGSGWYEERYMLRQDEFEMISEWAYKLDIGPSQDRSDIMIGVYLTALRNLRTKAIFEDSTAILLVSAGMGDSEVYAIAELLNSPEVIKALADTLTRDDQGLRAMRQHYSHYRLQPEPGGPAEGSGPFHVEANRKSSVDAPRR